MSLLSTGLRESEAAKLAGSRTYDYTQKYGPDKPGEEAEENARVWNVYLDEAENYDADLIQGYRNIIDGLLVFASLFSAVVTTFVAQTSQALQPDNAQILVSLLLETNQLLRTAGNSTNIHAVPTAALGPGSLTYSLTDLWVNGLFFTSLALSLSTALLTVLAKQWIQAYTSIIPGGAKTRALIRHFRFQGLVKWKLGDIIGILPLILHSSVAVFFIGLALYISQLSSPICGVVVSITALTLLFYLGTSLIPAVFFDCPYRIPFLFSLARFIQIQAKMEGAILAAIDTGDHVLLKYLLYWSQPEFLEANFLEGALLHQLASSNGNGEHITYVLDHGFDASRQHENGMTALHLAVAGNNLDAVIALVEKEPSLISVRTNPPHSRTALDLGLRWGYSDIVAYLLDKGPDKPPDALRAALHIMPWNLSLDLVKVLLDRGWDRTVKDAEGRALIDVAKANGRHNIAEYLEYYQTVKVRPNPAVLDISDT
ncbi:hypothetical protein C0995_010227 [Termitomyces sp. Mi166|nr:hypothetical protein C0995_010227 [Termitomyces sp. Mi166\